jgi:hypothetical protein
MEFIPRGRSGLGRRRLAAATFAAAIARPALAQAPPELRLGAVFPLSGPLALLGDESFRGVELAVEERNAGGGVLGRPLRLIRADAPDDVAAAAETRRLVAGQDRVAAIFGSVSSAVALPGSQVAEAAGVQDAHPHRFRHTMAIEYLRNGGNERTLQEVLGHESLEMLRTYTRIALADVKNGHVIASPVENWRL